MPGLLLIAALNASIGYYVLRQRPRELSNRCFSFFAFCVATWTIAVALAHNVNWASTIFTRGTFSAASIMMFALFTLFRTFPHEPVLHRDGWLTLFGLISTSLAGLSFSPLIVYHSNLTSEGLQVTYGPLHRFFGFYVYSAFAAALVVLLKKYHASTGLARLQFNYLLLGLVVPGIAVTFTNLLIPLVSGRSRSGQYGPYFALIFLAFTAHALIRYRFMDIRLILREGITYLLGLTASLLCLLAVLFLAWYVLGFDLSALQLLLLVSGSVALSVLFPLLRDLFGALIDRYVYRTKIGYQYELRDIGRTLTTTLDLDTLLAYAARRVQRLLRSERAALYLRGSQCFALASEHRHPTVAGSPSSPSMEASAPVPSFFQVHPEPLVAEEVPRRFPQAAGLSAELARHHWGLVLPIHAKHDLEGFLAIGPKLSGDPFFPDELEFLTILVAQVGIAVRNANLYREVILVNEYVSNLLATIDSAVIAVDSSGRVSICNNAAAHLTGTTVDEMRRASINTLAPPVAEFLGATLSDGRLRAQQESVVIDREGRLTPIVCSTSPLRDRNGSVLGAVMVFSDLSRLKQLERDKRRAERLAAFGAFASGIAHEIKNPLVAIRTFAELLPERYTDDEFRQDFSAVVLREIDRIDHLIARLRGLAVSSDAPFSIVDIRHPIDDVLALLRAQVLQKNIHVSRNTLATHTHISGDLDQLKQLFLNVFMNSIEAMEKGGELHITLRDEVQREGHWVTVEVTDTGPGIPEPLLGRIFEPFVTTKASGSGLGLAICRGITDAHKAVIRAANRDGARGALITIDFPAVLDAQGALTQQGVA